MHLRLYTLGSLYLLATGCVWGPPFYNEPGVYAGVSGNFATEDFDLDSGVRANGTGGVGARVGYRFHPHFAAEFDIDYFHGFEATVNGVSQERSADLEFVAFTLNGKGYLQKGLVQPYGLIGFGGLAGETVSRKGTATNPFLDRSHDTAFTFRLGGGLEFHDVLHGIVEHAPVFFFADVSAWLPTDELQDYRFVLFSVGLAWKFGGHHEGDEHEEHGPAPAGGAHEPEFRRNRHE